MINKIKKILHRLLIPKRYFEPISVVGGELEQVDGVYVCDYYDPVTNTAYVDTEDQSGGDE